MEEAYIAFNEGRSKYLFIYPLIVIFFLIVIYFVIVIRQGKCLSGATEDILGYLQYSIFVIRIQEPFALLISSAVAFIIALSIITGVELQRAFATFCLACKPGLFLIVPVIWFTDIPFTGRIICLGYHDGWVKSYMIVIPFIIPLLFSFFNWMWYLLHLKK